MIVVGNPFMGRSSTDVCWTRLGRREEENSTGPSVGKVSSMSETPDLRWAIVTHQVTTTVSRCDVKGWTPKMSSQSIST